MGQAEHGRHHSPPFRPEHEPPAIHIQRHDIVGVPPYPHHARALWTSCLPGPLKQGCGLHQSDGRAVNGGQSTTASPVSAGGSSRVQSGGRPLRRSNTSTKKSAFGCGPPHHVSSLARTASQRGPAWVTETVRVHSRVLPAGAFSGKRHSFTAARTRASAAASAALIRARTAAGAPPVTRGMAWTPWDSDPFGRRRTGPSAQAGTGSISTAAAARIARAIFLLRVRQAGRWRPGL